MSNDWSKLPAPPPPLFLGKKEKDLVRQVNMEIEERVLGQQILYYPLDVESSQYNMYGECINKMYLPPLHIYCLIDWEGSKTEQSAFGIDRTQTITVHFHRRRLTEDQNAWIMEGDVILLGSSYYEIVEINEPAIVFGQEDNKMEISCKCNKIRDGFFIGEK